MIHLNAWFLRPKAALVLLGLLYSLSAHALTLGPVTVQSALGEPLRAEIEILSITPEEAASLKVNVAHQSHFKAAGLQYNPALSGTQIMLQRRINGRSFLYLSSNTRVTEPFVDLVLETTWATGRFIRDFTLLFDPPNLRAAKSARPLASASAPITPPVLSPVAAPTTAPTIVTTPTLSPTPPLAAPATTTSPSSTATALEPTRHVPNKVSSAAPPTSSASRIASTSATEPAPAATPKPSVATPPTARSDSTERIVLAPTEQVVVKPGNTAAKIATLHKPANVSLDQMLVALLQTNPDAFVANNVNRLKAGAVLDLPSSTDVSAIDANVATRSIVAQSKSFNEFRRKLAENTSAAVVAHADRQASGKVQAQVQESAAPAAAADKLTLSKGAVHANPSAKTSSSTEDKIAQQRQAQDNDARVAELKKNISSLKQLGSAATGAPTTSAGMTSTTSTHTAKAILTPPGPPSKQVASAGEKSKITTTTLAPLPAASTASAATPKATGANLLSAFTDNLGVLLATTSLLVLLAGFGFYQSRQYKTPAQVDSSFLESRLQPDSFFGVSGGQQVDTAQANTHPAAPVYSPSQFEATSDVDPVAEADVYLAYGRDLQAEEILKEALKANPTRVAIYAKLAEIHAKRHDTASFETIAREAFIHTQGIGVEWAHICTLGRELGSADPVFQLHGGSFAATQDSEEPADVPPTPVKLDLPVQPSPSAAAVDIDLNSNFHIQRAAPQTHTAASTPKVDESQDARMLSFDLNSLSLELDSPISSAESAPSTADLTADPLQTKLSLAEEFVAIGDVDGARSLAEEVLMQASGELKDKAQRLLNNLV